MSTLLEGQLLYLVVAWGIITALLLLLLVYRKTIASKEEDQLFLDGAESRLAAEQQDVALRLARLTKPIVVLAVLSAVLLLVISGLWMRERMSPFM